MRRQPVAVGPHSIRYIGKESNRLHDLDAGLIHEEAQILASYRDLRCERNQWDEDYLPHLRHIGVAQLHALTGIPARTLRDILAGRAYPRRRGREALIALALAANP